MAPERPRAERNRNAAWEYLARKVDPESMCEGRVEEVARPLDHLIADGSVFSADETTLLAALLVIRDLRDDLTEAEKRLIDAARERGVTWSRLAVALEVKSRQAAERRWASLREPTYGEASTQRDRVAELRDERARTRAGQQWCRTHAEEIRAAARALVATGDLQEHADTAEYAFERRVNRSAFLPLPRPASWPKRLADMIQDPAADLSDMLWQCRKTTLDSMADFAAAHPELVERVRELCRGEADAEHAVEEARWDARYGPDDGEVPE